MIFRVWQNRNSFFTLSLIKESFRFHNSHKACCNAQVLGHTPILRQVNESSNAHSSRLIFSPRNCKQMDATISSNHTKKWVLVKEKDNLDRFRTLVSDCH